MPARTAPAALDVGLVSDGSEVAPVRAASRASDRAARRPAAWPSAPGTVRSRLWAISRLTSRTTSLIATRISASVRAATHSSVVAWNTGVRWNCQTWSRSSSSRRRSLRARPAARRAQLVREPERDVRAPPRRGTVRASGSSASASPARRQHARRRCASSVRRSPPRSGRRALRPAARFSSSRGARPGSGAAGLWQRPGSSSALSSQEPTACISRSWRLSTLPVGVRGSASRNVTSRGTL